jgi:hypothetical protein
LLAPEPQQALLRAFAERRGDVDYLLELLRAEICSCAASLDFWTRHPEHALTFVYKDNVWGCGNIHLAVLRTEFERKLQAMRRRFESTAASIHRRMEENNIECVSVVQKLEAKETV